MDQRNTRALLAELVGTAVLVFFICTVVIVAGGGTLRVDWVAIAGSHLLVLATLVAALGGVSGGHFNPAVTIALAALGRFERALVGPYILVQTIGATLGALVVKLILDDPGKIANYGAPAVNTRVLSGDFGGFVCEAVGTFVLVAAIVGVAVIVKNQGPLTPLIIGGALGLGALAFAPLTGNGLNPARAFGPSLIAGEFGGLGTFIFVYVLGPIAGGLLAAAVVNQLYVEEPAPA